MVPSQILEKNLVTKDSTNYWRYKMDNLPKDPIMFLSVINTKLRDIYRSLDDLCDDLFIDRAVIEEKLKGIDYEYDESRNQFI